MITFLLSQAWPYIAWVGALVAALVVGWFTAKASERAAAALKISKQQAAARKVDRDAKNKVAGMSDDAIDHALGEWVRK